MHDTPLHNNKKLLTALGLLFITAFLAYWQVISFSNCLKWDMIDQYFPWRYHVVACLRNGELPLWNPYNFAGYPIHADPQSGAWYIPLWLFALFGNYTSHANAVEVFLHIWLAGVGMYLLTHRFYKNERIALIAGASYIGCGLLVGNAQHFTYIISACWLPFVLLYFVKTIDDKGLKNPLGLAVFLWLLFTGGYPAFFIITAYILAIGFVLYWLMNRAETKRLLINAGLAGVVFLLLASPSIVSFALYWNDTTRSGGLALADALFGPFRVQDVQSFFNPMLSAIKKENTGTDLSMMNGYFGLVPLVFLALIIPFYKQLGRLEWFVFTTTIICLLAAFGDTFFIPVREWLFHLPALNIFRFPAIFRLFVIIGFVLMGSWGLSRVYNSGERKWLLAGVGGVAAIVLVLSFKNTELGSIASDFKAFHFIWAELPGSSAAAVLGGSLQLVFLGLVFFFRKNLKALSFIAMANCIVFVQLNIKTTVINKESTQVIDDFLTKMPKDFAVDNTRPMGDIHFDAPAPLWRNLGIFYRQPSFDGNNPFRLRNFAEFESADSISNYAEKPVFWLKNNSDTIEVTGKLNKFQVQINVDRPDTLIINQNMALNWDIKYDLMATMSRDGMPSMNAMLRSITSQTEIKAGVITRINLSEGDSTISFKYDPPYVFEFFIISCVILFLVFGTFIFKS